MVVESSQFLFRQLDLTQQLRWLVRLRWMAVGGLAVAIAVARGAGLIDGESIALWSLTGLLAILNLFYRARILGAIRWRERTPMLCGHCQVVMDLLVLAAMVHLTGGLENPLLFYFTFHVAIAAILFGLKVSLLFSALATTLALAVGLGEFYGWLPHHHLGLGPCMEAHHAVASVTLVLFALASVCVGISYLVSSIYHQTEELHRRAGHQEQMVSLGMLAAGIAHEIGNPLAAISSLAQLIRRKSQDEKLSERMGLLLEQVSRIRKIVEDMVNFARPAETHWRPVHVNATVEQAVELLRYDPRCKQVSVDVHLDEQLPALYLSPEQLLQVCMNLLINALDAMPEGGRLSVGTSRADSEVLITVRDTGPGIDREIRNRVFEPFFTTKPVGKGTGLGLSVSFGIVRSFGGTITFDSPGGQGTEFRIHLPLIDFSGEANVARSGD